MTSSTSGRARVIRCVLAAVAAACMFAALAPVSAFAHHKPYAATISDASVNEGDSGTTPMTFTITLAPQAAESITLNYSTANGSAQAGSDYTATSGSVTFAANQSSKTVTVLARGDTDFEPDESFNVNLSGSGKKVHLTDAQGVGTIVNDDTAPAFAVTSVTVTEGDSGQANAVFDVTLDRAPPSTATVNYATLAVTATGGDSSADGADFKNSSGTLTFAAGDVTEPVAIPVYGDSIDEPDETFRVYLSGNSAGTTITGEPGLGTILDNDPEPSLSVSDAMANEPAEATSSNSAVFTVSLSAASQKTVTVDYATADLDPAEAVGGSDYSSVSDTLTFDAGQRTKEVVVPILYDGIDPGNPEGFEKFNLNLIPRSGGNASVSDGTGLGIITEDTVPTLYVSDVAIDEGDSGQDMAEVSLTLSAPSDGMVSGTFSTADGVAPTATADVDYVSSTNAAFSFDGSVERRTTIQIPVNGDTIDEDNEKFDVVVTTSDVGMGDDTATITILDDDQAPVVSIGDVTITEGNAGPTNVNFTVTLSNPSGRSIAIDYTTADGTAVSPADYEADSGQVVVAGGESSKPITIKVEGDTVDEPKLETFFVDITPEAGKATVGDGRGQGTIVDDDKTRTTTTLRVRKLRRIVATGLVSPAVAGQSMVVTLFRKKAGRWVRIATRRPRLIGNTDVNGDGKTDSRYRSRFRKPRQGRCTVVSRYLGDAEHMPSRAVKRFRCR